MNLQERLAQIKLLVLDHDGVLTDNHVYVNERGEEMCRYSRADGIGIERVKKLGVAVICISTESNPIVAKRCEKLKIPCYQKSRNKFATLKWFCKVPLEMVAYVGNDINDLECLKAVGFSWLIEDSEQSLKDCFTPNLFTIRKGGEGAVREICDMIADAIETIHSFKDVSTRLQEGTLVLPEHWAGFWGYKDYSA